MMRLAEFTLDSTEKTKLIDVPWQDDWSSCHSLYAQNSNAEQAQITISQTIQGIEQDAFTMTLEPNQNEPVLISDILLEIEPASFVSAMSTKSNVTLTFVLVDHEL